MCAAPWKSAVVIFTTQSSGDRTAAAAPTTPALAATAGETCATAPAVAAATGRPRGAAGGLGGPAAVLLRVPESSVGSSSSFVIGARGAEAAAGGGRPSPARSRSGVAMYL